MAVQLGDLSSSRAVGEMLSENEDPIKYPCHRVVRSDGTLGGFTHPLGLKEKIARLGREGVKVSNGKIENFERIRFNGFKSDFPLKRFRSNIRKIKFEEGYDVPNELRAMDITYYGRKGIGVAVDFSEEITFEIAIREVKSPYIPNYLYLREGEIYENLVRRDKLNILDGNGILHRERKGVATLVGATKNAPTVGLAKSLLMGKIEKDIVFVDDQPVAKKFGKYFISPGYKVSLQSSYDLLTGNDYFPQTRYPDRISRRYRNEILPFQYSI